MFLPAPAVGKVPAAAGTATGIARRTTRALAGMMKLGLMIREKSLVLEDPRSSGFGGPVIHLLGEMSMILKMKKLELMVL